MTTLTLTPRGPAVQLTLTPTETITSILRSDVNGNASVRVPAGTFPRTGPLVLEDWEASLTGIVTYTAGPAVARITMAGTDPWLITPLRPAGSVRLEQVTDYAATHQSLATLHQVVDRPDPLAALGRLTTRTGSLSILCPDYAAATARKDALDRAGIVLLKTPDRPGMDMYFIPTQASYRPAADRWMLEVAYTEVARPASPISAAVWTFGTVSASYPSFANISSGYDDFEGLSLNDRTGIDY